MWQTGGRGVRGGGDSIVGVENEVEHDNAHDIVGEHREQRVPVARSERDPGIVVRPWTIRSPILFRGWGVRSFSFWLVTNMTACEARQIT